MHRAIEKMSMSASNATADNNTPSSYPVKWHPSIPINGLQPLKNLVCEALKLSIQSIVTNIILASDTINTVHAKIPKNNIQIRLSQAKPRDKKDERNLFF
ncbi:hypothetical protein ACOSP7_004326 [Xanthoceras sorbifolium]